MYIMYQFQVLPTCFIFYTTIYLMRQGRTQSIDMLCDTRKKPYKMNKYADTLCTCI